MYSKREARCIMDWDGSCARVYCHSGRTDADGGHRDWLNRSGWGFLSYHYHHKLPAHLHTNGKCPYGNKKEVHIVNPYTGKQVGIGIPYDFEGESYFSLDLVSRTLTADDEQGVRYGTNEGGSFFACSSGDSTKGNLGEIFSFVYPERFGKFLGLKDNEIFESKDGKIKLLATSDGISTKAYISLKTVCDYMTENGYFTNFSDGGSGVWRFEVRKPIVQIISPKNGGAFNVGDEITVMANIKNVSSAKLIAGDHYNGTSGGFEENKHNLVNQEKVSFSKFKLTESNIGESSIENGNLSIKVNGHTGGTTIYAETDSLLHGDSVNIHIVEPDKKEKIDIAPWLFGFKGKPTATGGKSVTYPVEEWEKLKEIKAGIDWYSYEGRTKINDFTAPYLTGREFNIGPYGELTDETNKYWVTLGPKVFISDYPDEGALIAYEFGDHIGCRVDVVLYNDETNEYAYVECVFSGNIKAHTFNNGIFQTGHPYPNSSSAITEPYEVGYVNGSTVEFTGAKPPTNGEMSKYSFIELIVYPK